MNESELGKGGLEGVGILFKIRLDAGLAVAEKRSCSARVFFIHLGEVDCDMSNPSEGACAHQYIRRLERGTVHVVDPIFPQHL